MALPRGMPMRLQLLGVKLREGVEMDLFSE